MPPRKRLRKSNKSHFPRTAFVAREKAKSGVKEEEKQMTVSLQMDNNTTNWILFAKRFFKLYAVDRHGTLGEILPFFIGTITINIVVNIYLPSWHSHNSRQNIRVLFCAAFGFRAEA